MRERLGEHIGLLFTTQPDDNIKLTAGCHKHLNTVQVLAVLLQQPADCWQFLLIQPLPVEVLIALEGFLELSASISISACPFTTFSSA